MPRKNKRKGESPLFIGLSSLIAILLIISMAFTAPFVPVVTPSGETINLSFSSLGVPLLALLMLVILFVKVKK